MEINISGKHINLTPAMEEYAQKKCDRLPRFYDRLQEVNVVVDRPSREFEVEVIAHVANHDPFIASCGGEDFYGCVDNVVDKLTRQLSEHKDRIRNRKHP
ncbi:MAG: ribosome-associated translation inhibitor RaiA [Planctomycetes bacterium]|nr:ribosome-associated translation inhibitor RaiA [Planctomycetota bacterium]NOG56012.1 ribosome-associated translation inhibitor RaiA [Planctomycetota bacterium]